MQIRVSPLFNVCGMVEASIKMKQKSYYWLFDSILFFDLIENRAEKVTDLYYLCRLKIKENEIGY